MAKGLTIALTAAQKWIEKRGGQGIMSLADQNTSFEEEE